MTIDEEKPTVQPYNVNRQSLEEIKREEIANDIEIELVQHFLDDIKRHFGKPGLLSNYVWRHLKKLIEKAGPNYKKLGQKLMRNLEWRKRLAINKASRETDVERKAIVFVQYAMRIIHIFDYICPTTVIKTDFIDLKRQHLYIHLAQRELDIKNEEEAPLRHDVRTELDYKVAPPGYGFASPAHSSRSDTESVRMIRNLDKAETTSFYPDDESSNGSFLSVQEYYSATEDNEEPTS